MAKKTLTGDKGLLDVALYEWYLKGKLWLSEMRNDEIKRLKEAYQQDRQAIGEIELALKGF